MKENWYLLEKLGLLVVPDFLDAGTRERLLHEAEAGMAYMATIGVEPRVDLERRRTKVVSLSEETRAAVSAKLRALQPTLASHFEHDLEGVEPFQLLRY